ncbi:tetraspanin [Westerdykella ornata]|uniref:Tetraspanin n=1 Tax=Westerdykella ornata TaxID=318751 RepID=A0A6A6JZF3_WESOR|nr:tetraspanin [Westerdykella ornata]KAF2281614.1 tetraspanin [Westerdykella ornata]
MPTKLMMIFVAFDIIFAACGGLLMGFSLVSEQTMRGDPTLDNVARNLLLDQCPLTAGVVNAIFIFVTFLLSLPALFLPTNRGWLRAQGWLVVFCAVFTLGLGLSVWVSTLQTRRQLGVMWGQQTPLIQSLLQQKFNCCGYHNSTSPPFIQDTTCTNSLVAAQKAGCIGDFSKFANGYLDLIFTAAFGMVGVDAILVLCVAMVIQYRNEQERYRHIDEKVGTGAF